MLPGTKFKERIRKKTFSKTEMFYVFCLEYLESNVKIKKIILKKKYFIAFYECFG